MFSVNSKRKFDIISIILHYGFMVFNINFVLIHFGLYCGVEILKHHIFKSYKSFVFKAENVKT